MIEAPRAVIEFDKETAPTTWSFLLIAANATRWMQSRTFGALSTLFVN